MFMQYIKTASCSKHFIPFWGTKDASPSVAFVRGTTHGDFGDIPLITGTSLSVSWMTYNSIPCVQSHLSCYMFWIEEFQVPPWKDNLHRSGSQLPKIPHLSSHASRIESRSTTSVWNPSEDGLKLWIWLLLCLVRPSLVGSCTTDSPFHPVTRT
jgi:hypothetical protein